MCAPVFGALVRAPVLGARMQAFGRGSAVLAMKTANRAKKCTASRTPAAAAPVLVVDTDVCTQNTEHDSAGLARRIIAKQALTRGPPTRPHQLWGRARRVTRENLFFGPSWRRLCVVVPTNQPAIRVPLGADTLERATAWQRWPRGPTMCA